MYTHLNYSIYGIIAFWVMSVVPHFIALFVLAKANNWNYDNRRPWTADDEVKLKAAVPSGVWSKYKKLEAVSRNSFENFPLFATAVILGVVADLKQADCLNAYVLLFLGLRLFYAIVYVFGTTQTCSYVRTGTWVLSVAVPLWIIWQAAFKMSTRIVMNV